MIRLFVAIALAGAIWPLRWLAPPLHRGLRALVWRVRGIGEPIVLTRAPRPTETRNQRRRRRQRQARS